MQIFTLDPLLDPRWDELVASHPQASAFHSTGWLRALAKTYGYRPVVLTSAPPGRQLSDGIAFCEIRSWITGSRLVSLPFSDHAQPLLSAQGDTLEGAEWLNAAHSDFRWRYVELRPICARPGWGSSLRTSQSFWLHTLSLEPPIEKLFSNMHKSSIQRRIRHAESGSLEYERGSSSHLISCFYDLLVITRKRHRLLPQPESWFRTLLREMGPDAEIRLVRKEGIPIAAMLSLRHRGTVIYKYGCSDHRFHHLGGVPFLFWKLIQESKSEGSLQIDLGRTDFGNQSLAEFKDRLGAARKTISYLRYPTPERQKRMQLPERNVVGGFVASLPRGLSSGLGRLVYRHIG